MQVGFGLYPVVVKEFAAKEKANPVIFSFYRQVSVMARKGEGLPLVLSWPVE